MSVRTVTEIVPPGDTRLRAKAWELKEEIRRQDDIFYQTEQFFMDVYAKSRVYCYREMGSNTLIGFAAVRSNGYILFLAVRDTYRGDGFGKGLIAQAVDDHGEVTCHVRTTNSNAIAFYEQLGFVRIRTVPDYYRDGGDAYLLHLSDNPTS